MDIRTKREKAFDRLLSFIEKNITNPSHCLAALKEAKEMYDKMGSDPKADNGGHAHTVPGIKTAIMTNEKYAHYFVKPSKYEKLLAKYEAKVNEAEKKDTL